jgi:hypothetical protein
MIVKPTEKTHVPWSLNYIGPRLVAPTSLQNHYVHANVGLQIHALTDEKPRPRS